jgi:signal transduction histidine kinase
MKTHDQFQGGDSPAVLAGSLRPRSGASSSAAALLEPSRSRTVADCEDTLHAVRSGLAGLAGALHLLTEQRAELPDESLRRVEALVVDEIERLRRLVAPPAPETTDAPGEDVDLDAVIGHLVLGRRTAGQEVAWTPTGCRVRGTGDDLIEVLNILLVNASRHAQGAPARIEAVREDATVVVRVSDDGPGVLPELRETIFERGVCRPGSRGQGLGLAMARGLVERAGGTLTLAEADTGGACFCVVLPALEQGEAA